MRYTALNLASLALYNALYNAPAMLPNRRTVTCSLARLLNLDLEGCEDNDIALADQAIRNHLLNNDDSLEVALIIMAMFCVYTIGVDNCSGKHVPNFGKFPTELDDNVNALVRRYEDNGVNALCDSLRLTNELVAIINILECGTRYDPLSGSVVTAAKNLAYRYR